MFEITKDQLNSEYELIDIRTAEERQEHHIGGNWVPMPKIMDYLSHLPKDKKVVLYCRSGNRSGRVVKEAREKLRMTHIYSLAGGIG